MYTESDSKIEISSAPKPRRSTIVSRPMYTLRLFFAFFCSLCHLTSVENPKEEINRLLQNCEQASPDDYVLLAKAYCRDQDLQKAIETFLHALEMLPSVKKPKTLPDQAIYEECMPFYLTNHTENSLAISEEIISRYQKINDKNPDYYQINYLLASSFANLGEMETFFDLFYHSYRHLPDHYLAYKTKAILHIKLLERSIDEEYRELQRRSICLCLLKASDSCSKDSGLYKLIFSYAPAGDKKMLVKTVLQKILAENIMVPRADLLFYLENALSVNENKLGKEFVDRAKCWYANSRALEKAQLLVERSNPESGF